MKSVLFALIAMILVVPTTLAQTIPAPDLPCDPSTARFELNPYEPNTYLLLFRCSGMQEVYSARIFSDSMSIQFADDANPYMRPNVDKGLSLMKTGDETAFVLTDRGRLVWSSANIMAAHVYDRYATSNDAYTIVVLSEDNVRQVWFVNWHAEVKLIEAGTNILDAVAYRYDNDMYMLILWYDGSITRKRVD